MVVDVGSFISVVSLGAEHGLACEGMSSCWSKLALLVVPMEVSSVWKVPVEGRDSKNEEDFCRLQ